MINIYVQEIESKYGRVDIFSIKIKNKSYWIDFKNKQQINVNGTERQIRRIQK